MTRSGRRLTPPGRFRRRVPRLGIAARKSRSVSPMKLGTGHRLLVGGPAARHRRVGARGRAPRLRLVVDGRGLRLRRPHPAGLVGAQTSRIRLGTAICQMPARTPDGHRHGGHDAWTTSPEGGFILGLGASGPQVVEGWYGQPYPKPLARTREYVDIVREIVAREEPVAFSGDHYSLPYEGGTGLGKAAEVHDPPPPGRPAHLPGGRGAEERRPGGRDRRRLGGHALRPPRTTPGTGSAWPRGSPGALGRAAPRGGLRGGLPWCRSSSTPTSKRAADMRPAVPRPLRRRHGRQGGQLPLRRLRPDGLRGGGDQDPGAVPGRRQGRRPSPPSPPSWWRRSRWSARRRRSATTSRPGRRRWSPPCSSPARRRCCGRWPRLVL